MPREDLGKRPDILETPEHAPINLIARYELLEVSPSKQATEMKAKKKWNKLKTIDLCLFSLLCFA
jgi:hypothetical protein